jgi:hypothetical protein
MIAMLQKALKRGYLKGCPNLTLRGIAKYLNPSPATAKGHMAHPQQGIRSTQCHAPNSSTNNTMESTANSTSPDVIPMHNPQLPARTPLPNLIEDNNVSEDNMFVFAAFADKRDGTL